MSSELLSLCDDVASNSSGYLECSMEYGVWSIGVKSGVCHEYCNKECSKILG